MAQPASIPSIQTRNGLRQRAGEISERAAISENAKRMAQKLTHKDSRRAAGKHNRSASALKAKPATDRAVLRVVFMIVKRCSCSNSKFLVSQLRSCALKKMFAKLHSPSTCEKNNWIKTFRTRNLSLQGATGRRAIRETRAA
jgi:hypothetical protein